MPCRGGGPGGTSRHITEQCRAPRKGRSGCRDRYSCRHPCRARSCRPIGRADRHPQGRPWPCSNCRTPAAPRAVLCGSAAQAKGQQRGSTGCILYRRSGRCELLMAVPSPARPVTAINKARGTVHRLSSLLRRLLNRHNQSASSTLPKSAFDRSGTPMFKSMRSSGSTWALPLILCALLVRMTVPAGWMPSVDGAGITHISLCTGAGTQEAWIDSKGVIHKSDPAPTQHSDHPCVFSGLSAALDAPTLTTIDPPVSVAIVATTLARAVASVGRGLAAPPPPATGPPV
jgi:hypothetical protein